MREEMNFGQQSTKVKQLSDIIEQDIRMGRYKTRSALPSINCLSEAYGVSRDTVFKAFSLLKERRLIDAVPGKGYYVINRQERIFLLLDEYSPFKDTLYNSFIKGLASSYKVDLWFHQYERIGGDAVDFVRKESYSEDAVLTVFQGLEIPERLREYGWSCKSVLYTTDDAVRVAEECGVQIISVTGTKGVIGAVAAIGCFDIGERAAGIPEDFE